MFEIVSYTPELKTEWDSVIRNSRNGTFLFYRDYMDYHSDRFMDNSFLVRKKNKFVATLPGNANNNIFYSHQGLTYGGLIVTDKIVTSDVIEIYDQINLLLKEKGINKVQIKPIPHIYHQKPAEEEIYALFRLGAKKIGCNISSAIIQHNKINFSELRRRGVKKSKKINVRVSHSNDFEKFWQILKDNLSSKHNTKPVHSLSEIKYLNSKFPDNIKLFTAEFERELVAGVVVYVIPNVLHVQYISATNEGKKQGALDYLFNYLVNEKFAHVSIFDFGQSTEEMGNYLNEGLIFQKEGFGGRGLVYETYEYLL